MHFIFFHSREQTRSTTFCDWADGYIARRLGQISRWGKILDPLADKVSIGAIAIALVCFKNLPVWLLVVVLVRDAAIFLGGVYLAKQCDVVLASNSWGKATSLALCALLLAYFWDAEALEAALAGISVALLVISLISYTRRFFFTIKNRRRRRADQRDHTRSQ